MPMTATRREVAFVVAKNSKTTNRSINQFICSQKQHEYKSETQELKARRTSPKIWNKVRLQVQLSGHESHMSACHKYLSHKFKNSKCFQDMWVKIKVKVTENSLKV